MRSGPALRMWDVSIDLPSRLHQGSLLNDPYYTVELRMVGLIGIAQNCLVPLKC